MGWRCMHSLSSARWLRLDDIESEMKAVIWWRMNVDLVAVSNFFRDQAWFRDLPGWLLFCDTVVSAIIWTMTVMFKQFSIYSNYGDLRINHELLADKFQFQFQVFIFHANECLCLYLPSYLWNHNWDGSNDANGNKWFRERISYPIQRLGPSGFSCGVWTLFKFMRKMTSGYCNSFLPCSVQFRCVFELFLTRTIKAHFPNHPWIDQRVEKDSATKWFIGKRSSSAHCVCAFKLW